MDEKILKLQEKVNNKREKLNNKTTRFSPRTNCSLEVNGMRYNLNVINKDDLINLLVMLNMHKISADNLEIFSRENWDCIISGYRVEAWMNDIEQRLDIIKVTEERAELNKLEKKLDKLLSNDKKAELEIEAIAKLLE